MISYWGNNYMDKPKHFIFGFGSIVNDDSRRRTAPKAGLAFPVRISKHFGYKRVWGYQSSKAKLTALGLAKATTQQASSINGVLYSVTESDLMAFDKRECGYKRINIPHIYIESYNWIPIPNFGQVWVYVPIGPKGKLGTDLAPADKYYPILQTYLDTTLLGFLKYGVTFAMEFLDTTSWWSEYWLNDRQIPRRPWLYQKEFSKLDNILESKSSSNGFYNIHDIKTNLYIERKLPVEFSIYFITEKCENYHKIQHKLYGNRHIAYTPVDISYHTIHN